MKFMLIALNVILAAAVAHLAWTYSSEPLEFASTSNKPAAAKIEKKKAVKVKASEKYVLDSPDVTEKKIAAVLDRNIFKTERVPDAPANKTAQRNNQQIRADMSLVGTYVIGDSLGAIILQRLQGNAQQQLKALQQKEYEQYSASTTRVTDPKKKAAAAAEDGEADEEKKEPAEVEAGKSIVIVGGSPTISANNVFRQHLKVGDTTVNGYKLEEVTRTSAVLTKNNERIELTLLTPSEAGNVARQRQNNNQNNQNRNNNNNNNNNQNNQNRNNNNNNARNNNNNQNRNNNNQNRNNNNNRNRDEFQWF